MEQMRIHNRMAEELRIISVSSTGPDPSADVATGI
jgi:hypothetical protein